MSGIEQAPLIAAGISFEAALEVLRQAFQGSPDLVFAAGVDGRVLFANDALRTRVPEVTLHVPATSLFPDDARAAFEALQTLVLSRGQSARFEWGEMGPAGARRWFGCTVSPLGAAGAGYLCVSSDATELKRSEARLRRSEQLMVDTQGVAHLGTWEWDISEPNAIWSSELYRIYGLSPTAYTPSYENYLKMVHPDDRQRVIDATNRVFHEHVRYSHDERIFRPDGSMRYLHTWAHPVLDDAGKLIRLVGVCQDITDQKLAEEEVKALNADLERRVAERTRTIENSLRDLEAFNAMASHDLRAPLSVIHGSCALILQGGAESLPARVTDNLARIQRSVTRMTALVNDLLALAQVGHAPLARGEVDVSALCHDVMAQLRRAAPERDVAFEVEPGLVCLGDVGLIRAAIENLLGNAWKYSSRVAQARIEVGMITSSDDQRAFYVRDNGAGFDMKDAHRLFAPFERLHKASEFEGTGVGLAAVHRIIERHGGRIWAEGEPGRGATFFFAMPAR
ncbi:MAG TPA: ATP-binding protein [Polyangia bacterium]|jgi:PAS domain S-box-containing protein